MPNMNILKNIVKLCSEVKWAKWKTKRVLSALITLK